MTESTLNTEAYENALFDLSRFLFSAILVRDAADDELWSQRVQTLEHNGLLSFLLPSPFKAAPIEVDESRLEDARYRRHLVRKLKAPRPGKHVSVRVAIKRDELSNAAYLADICKLLAYKWVSKLLPDTDWTEKLLLLKQDERILTRALDTMRMHQSDGKRVAQLVMRLTAEEILDGNTRMQEIVSSMKAESARVVADVSARIAQMNSGVLAEATAAIARITADAGRQCDAYLEVIRRDAEAARARTDKVLSECAPDPDPEASWRRAMEARERERKLANRRGNRLWCAFFLVIFGVLALHAEFGGFRAIDYLIEVAERLLAAG
ncbi:MAG TPA: hypothetical protein V6D08_08515 [Candidatus Obscuribacterales bacterium]